MTDILNEFVAERAAYFKQVHAEAQEALRFLNEATRPDPATGKVEPVVLERRLYEAITTPLQVFRDLSYGLDEAMAALDFYANPNTWTEVPAKTFAADDRGLKARVALARINPV